MKTKWSVKVTDEEKAAIDRLAAEKEALEEAVREMTIALLDADLERRESWTCRSAQWWASVIEKYGLLQGAEYTFHHATGEIGLKRPAPVKRRRAK